MDRDRDRLVLERVLGWCRSARSTAYEAALGHGGASHSLAFALRVSEALWVRAPSAALALVLAWRRRDPPRRREKRTSSHMLRVKFTLGRVPPPC